jgi:hypothetical protein
MIIDTSNALISHLLGLTITDITDNDIAFDNASFDPSGKDAWLDVAFIPADLNVDSKDTTGKEETGIFQVSVYVPENDLTGGIRNYANRQLQIASEILDGFATNTEASYNGVTVSTLDSSIQPMRKSGGWSVRDISINYYRLGA